MDWAFCSVNGLGLNFVEFLKVFQHFVNIFFQFFQVSCSKRQKLKKSLENLKKKKNYQIYRSSDGRVKKKIWKILENFGYFWNFLEN